MKITTIKKTSNKYKLVLENGDIVTTYDEIILNTNILYKREINESLLKKILLENKYYDIYYKVLKYIKTKLRSTNEIKKYIKKFDLSLEEENKMIDKLKNNKYIDDEIFVKAYIHDKITFSNVGPWKIRKELLSHKIDNEIIDREIEKIDEALLNQKLANLISKKITSNKTYSSNMLKQKLLNYFIDLGYDRKNIIEILEQNKDINDNNVLEKDYLKLYNKLKNKHEGNELKKVLKQKLYQKGFNLEDINNIID